MVCIILIVIHMNEHLSIQLPQGSVTTDLRGSGKFAPASCVVYLGI